MNEETKLILKSLKFLIAMSNPHTELFMEVRKELSEEIQLALHPKEEQSLEEKTKDALTDKDAKGDKSE